METFKGHSDRFVELHGSDVYAQFALEQEDIIRYAFDPVFFLSSLVCEIWRIASDELLVFDVHVSRHPLKTPYVRPFQTSGSRYLRNYNMPRRDFGLSWYLEKKLEKYFYSCWPPDETRENILIEAVIFTINKIMNCTTCCMICDNPLPFSMLKPSICDSSLCAFSFDEFGLGLDVASEIHGDPDAVDLLISFTAAVAVAENPKRFTPFPVNVHAKIKSNKDGPSSTKNITYLRFVDDPTQEITVEHCRRVYQVMNNIPSVASMQHFKTSQILKKELDKVDPLAFPLLKWILTSNRAHLARLKTTEQIPGCGTVAQFLLLSSAPALERAFTDAKAKQGAFKAYHGSGFANWHSILRNGLKNLSGTNLMSSGAAYGNGIYLAETSGVSSGYAQAAKGWKNSKYGEVGLSCISLCEVINAGYTAQPYYVVPVDNHVVTRYLFIYNPQNRHHTTKATEIQLPQTGYDQLFKDLANAKWT